MNTPLVLAFGLSDERVAKIKTMCLLQKLRLHVVPPAQYLAPLGALAGLEPLPQPQAEVSTLGEEMLVLCFFPDPTLDAFVAGFRKAGVPPVSLKAVLTPTNARWSAAALYEDIKKERAAMRGAR